MSALIRLTEEGIPEQPYKCMIKSCTNPEKPELGVKCTFCLRTAHYSCTGMKNDEVPDSLPEWFCVTQCAKNAESKKSHEQISILTKQAEVTKILMQKLMDRLEANEKAEAQRQDELSKHLERIKALEEENRRLTQQKHPFKEKSELFRTDHSNGENPDGHNEKITEKDALEIFADLEGDAAFKRRLTELFQHQELPQKSRSHERGYKNKEDVNNMSETEKLAYYQRLHVQRLEAPKLMKYAGDAAEWLSFKANYERMKERGEYDNETMVDKLRESLQGEAERYVKPRLNQPFADADQILEALRKRFFQPKEAVAKAWERLESWPQIPDKNRKALENFLVEIDSYIFLCVDLSFKPELEIAINSRLTNKLPYSIESKWHSYVSSKGIRGNITEFSEFMWSFVPNLPNREIVQASNGSNPRIKASVNVVQQQDQDKSKPFGAKKAKRDRPDCWFCGKDKKHPLYRCDEFRKISYDEKAKFLASNKICAKCLSSNQHTSSSCPRNGRIPKCSRKNCTDQAAHCTMMHPSSCDGAKNSSQSNDNHGGNASSSATTLHVKNNKATLFKVVPIYVIDGHGNRVETTLLMDPAAGASLVNMEFFKTLDITGRQYNLELSWLQPSAKHTDTQAIMHDLTIASINEPQRLIKLKGMTALPNVLLPHQEQHPEVIKAEYSYLRDAEIPSFKKQRPQILLGLPHAKWMISFETLVDFSRESAPVAERTPLGWTVCGSTSPSKSIFHCCKIDLNCIHTQEPTEDAESLQELHELVRYFNSFESLGIKEAGTNHLSKEDVHAEEIKVKTMRRRDNRYEIGLYWRDENCSLPNNYETALKRLRATEARLKHIGMVQWANEHHELLLKSGFARKATDEDLNPEIPHKRVNYVIGFVTFNLNKTPPKPRWVVDTSCKHEGISLNSRLLKGPDNLIPLTQALFQFRERKVAVVSDVTKMYHQIVIKEEDQQVQRYLWRDCDSSISPTIYIFENMLFGLNSSPSQANAIRIDHCEKSAAKYPKASKIGLCSMYMDDTFNSEDTEEEAIEAALQTIEMFKEISWMMVDFRSNNENVLKQLPHEAVDQVLLLDLTSDDDMTSRKVLGLFWDAKKDVFIFQMTNNLELITLSIDHNYHPTKREVLSFIMKIFDCLGLIAHFLIRGRMILQAIWRRGIAWEQHIPEDLHDTWIKWLEKFDEIQRLEIPRHYGIHSEKSRNISLHIFVDASLEAYAAVAYLRFETNMHVEIALVSGKARVAPVKYTSVPKLELMAALIGARMMKVIKDQHKRLKIDSTTFWSDSITVLRWLYSPSLRLQQFVAPRVTEIQELTNVNDWRYVPSEENVADDGTKWNDIDFSSSEHRWIKGPKFLYEVEEAWPCKFPANVNLEQKQVLLATRTKQTDDDTKAQYYAGIFETISAKIRSSWINYVMTVAWVLRFASNLNASIKGLKKNMSAILEVEEIDRSEKHIFSRIQNVTFKDEMKSLKNGLSVAQSSKLYSLNPFIDENGLIRAKTRMYKEDTIPYDMKCPIILPNKHETIHAYLNYLHVKNRHVGIEATIAESRSKVWIIHARKAVKRVRHQCLYCIEMRAKSHVPPTAPLPSCRLDRAARPFEHCGVDCAGPFTVYAGKSHVKKEVYIVIFTCMVTRAIYLRKLDSLTADEMLLAIQDVWTRRGPILHMYSDNGRNFIGAANIIKAEHLQQLASKRQIMWHFNPPLTPHWGGVWERLIKDVKRALNVEMNKTVIREKVFEAALLQIEDIMNSRPLTHLPVSPDDLAPLTPNYLLKLHPGYPFVGDKNTSEDSDSKHLTVKAQKISEKLNQRWLKEYLPIITKSDTRRSRNEGLKVDDYVVYCDPTIRPSDWKRGIIVNAHCGRDGYARVADVKLLNGQILERRSAVRLAKLEIDEKSFNENILFVNKKLNESEERVPVENADIHPTNVNKKNIEKFLNIFFEKINHTMAGTHQITVSQIIRLMTELEEAKFLKREEIRRNKSGNQKNLTEMTADDKFEDMHNKRTVRIHRIPNDCCFMELISVLARHRLQASRIICDDISQPKGFFANITFVDEESCDRALSLSNLQIKDTSCLITPTEYPKRTMTFKKYQFACITWTCREPTMSDHILIGRKNDSAEKTRAVPQLGKEWLTQYREYQRHVSGMPLVVVGQQSIELSGAEAAHNNPSSSNGRESPEPSTSTRAQKRLKSIIVVPTKKSRVGKKKSPERRVIIHPGSDSSPDYRNHKR